MRPRDQLRQDIVKTLQTVFPNADVVGGGLAFTSTVVDSETGKPFPVVINVRIADPLKYNIEAAKLKRPRGDEEKVEKKVDASAAANERMRLNMEYADRWLMQFAANDRGATATEIRDHVAEFQELTPMQVGKIMQKLCEAGRAYYRLDYFNKKYYMAAKVAPIPPDNEIEM